MSAPTIRTELPQTAPVGYRDRVDAIEFQRQANEQAWQTLGGLGIEEFKRTSLVEDLPQEEAVKVKFASFAGDITVRRALEQESAPKHESDIAVGPTLARSITEAKNGDEGANQRVDIAIDTATAEGWFKQKFFKRIRKELTADGEVTQFGLTTKAMHRDSITLRPNRPKRLKEFTLAEAKNGLREEEQILADQLQDSWLVAASCVPEDLPEEQLDHRGDGYFTKTMTYSLQGTTQEEREIITETIFDVGTNADEKATYQDRQSERFDVEAIGRVYEWLGLPAPKNALEMLERPMRVPKRLMPNGMVDFWRWVDLAADELRGERVRRTPEQYIARIEESRQRELSLKEVRANIKHGLYELEGTFKYDLQAVEDLWELVRKHGVKESVTNFNIDPIVFGSEAAPLIEQARHYSAIGDKVNLSIWMRAADAVAIVSGCGGGASRKKGEPGTLEEILEALINPYAEQQDSTENLEGGDERDENGKLEFRCQNGHKNKRERGGWVYNCGECGVDVSCGKKPKPIYQSVGMELFKFILSTRAESAESKATTGRP